jgi:hypothetical protein
MSKKKFHFPIKFFNCIQLQVLSRGVHEKTKSGKIMILILGFGFEKIAKDKYIYKKFLSQIKNLIH